MRKKYDRIALTPEESKEKKRSGYPFGNRTA